jgi:hypothetical protein
VALDLVPGWSRESTSAGAEMLEYAAGIAVGVLATLAVEKPVLRLRERLLPAADRAAQQPARHPDTRPAPRETREPVGSPA